MAALVAVSRQLGTGYPAQSGEITLKFVLFSFFVQKVGFGQIFLLNKKVHVGFTNVDHTGIEYITYEITVGCRLQNAEESIRSTEYLDVPRSKSFFD